MDFTFMLFDFPEKREMEKLYRDRRQDVAQEMEGNEATSDLMAWPGSAWLLLSFSPFPVRHPGDDQGGNSIG